MSDDGMKNLFKWFYSYDWATYPKGGDLDYDIVLARFKEDHEDHTELYNQTGAIFYMYKQHALGYAEWIQNNCIVSRNGFRLLPSLKEEISNDKAYELYLESLKIK